MVLDLTAGGMLSFVRSGGSRDTTSGRSHMEVEILSPNLFHLRSSWCRSCLLKSSVSILDAMSCRTWNCKHSQLSHYYEIQALQFRSYHDSLLVQALEIWAATL
jgi:hypothetical protein